MKILFIGGTGVISSEISKLVIANNDELFLLNRKSGAEFSQQNVTYIQGDIRDKDCIKQAIKNLDFDVVVDFICFSKQHAENDFELFQNKTKQFIFISSASCYQKPSTYYIISESTPLKNPFWQYSRDKIECEDYFMQKYQNDDFPITIVRPSHTYGKDKIPFSLTGAESSFTYIDMLLKGKEVVVHGDGTSLWTITHNSDFAKGFFGLIGNNSSIGNSFTITSDEILTWNQIINEIGQALNVTPKIIHISTDYICQKLPEFKGPLLGDKSNCAIFDNSKIKTFVPSFTCTKSFSTGIKETIDYIFKNKNLQIVDNNYVDKVQSLINSYKANQK